MLEHNAIVVGISYKKVLQISTKIIGGWFLQMWGNWSRSCYHLTISTDRPYLWEAFACFASISSEALNLCVRVPGVLWPHLAPRNTDARDESKDERRTQDTGRWRPIAGWLCLYSRSNSLSCGDNWPNGFLLRSEMSHKLKDFAELAAPSLYRRVRTTHDSAIFRAAFRSAVSENR